MFRRIPLILIILGLSACQTGGAGDVQTSEPAPPEMTLTPGEYVWNHRRGCARLIVGDAMSYENDQGCDGSVDYRGRNVFARGSTITIDNAYVLVSEANESRIAGTWKLNSYVTQVEFLRVGA